MPLHSRALPAGFIAPCLPSSAPHAPSGKEWLREIKHDGLRVIARNDGKRVKLYRPGNDLTDRFPLLAAQFSCAAQPACCCASLRSSAQGGPGDTASSH